MDSIKNFSGKRNTGLTFIIPPNIKLTKLLDPIMRIIRTLKNPTKRREITKVMTRVKIETKNIDEYKGFGEIICAGMSTDNKIFYTTIKPKKLIVNMEYYYDYSFNIKIIKEYIYADIINLVPEKEKDKTLNLIETSICNDEGLIIFTDILYKMLENKMVQEIYYFDKNISDDTIKYAINNKIVINHIIDDNFKKKYGEVVGKLYYPLCQ